MKRLGLIVLCALLAGCRFKTADRAGTLVIATADAAVEVCDWPQIVESGELIVGTVSGPETYFDYNGVPMGAQYALVENFAQENGLRIRIELAHNAAELRGKLLHGEVDLAACQLGRDETEADGLLAAGARDDGAQTSWAVAADRPELAAVLSEWYASAAATMRSPKAMTPSVTRIEVRRRVRAPYVSKEKGVISPYDADLKRAASVVGWDWRLLAAQCYQESGFDPQAVSTAGAQGLMQIMPTTAARVGLQDAFDPQENIAAAARYIRLLQQEFADVRDCSERIRFTLAAYNGGVGHIRDAQALARKHGRNAHAWADVEAYVRALSCPEVYADPVVRCGYMVGGETADYVKSIETRWRQYGGSVFQGAPVPTADPGRGQSRKPNRFTRGTAIVRPTD